MFFPNWLILLQKPAKVLGHSTISAKVCQEAVVGRRKSLSCMYDNLEATLVSKSLQWVKEPTKEVDKKAVTVLCTNSHCRKVVVGHVQQKSPWFYACFCTCPVALWTSLQLGNVSTMDVTTDWKFLPIFIFIDLNH